MALASGNPVSTAMYWKLSASGAIRVGSSPTEVNISFAFCVGVNHVQRRSKGDIQKCSKGGRQMGLLLIKKIERSGIFDLGPDRSNLRSILSIPNRKTINRYIRQR